MRNFNFLSKSYFRNLWIVGALGLSNVVNFAFNAYLGRSIPIEIFALIALLGSILSLSDIIIDSLRSAVIYKSAFFLGRFGSPAITFWKRTRKRGYSLALVACALWILLSPFLTFIFQVHTVFALLAISPMWLFLIISSIDGGYLAGNQKLSFVAFVALAEAVLKLLLAIAFVSLGLSSYAYLAITISSLCSFGLLVLGAKKLKATPKIRARNDGFPYKFYFSSFLSKASVIAYLSLDVLLAKIFLPPQQAGEYALLSLCGKAIYTAGSLFGQFLLPVLSHFEGKKISGSKAFAFIMMATTSSSLAAFTIVGVLGWITIPFVFGEKAIPILPYVFLYGLSMVAFSMATSIVTLHQIKGRHFLPFVGFFIAFLQLALITLFHSSIGTIATVMSLLGFVALAATFIADRFYPRIAAALSNISDFLELLTPLSFPKTKGLRILIFNWRDTRHIWAGGAEVYLHELSKEWVKKGNAVALFCGNDGVSPRNETVDGVRVIRRGGFYTVYIWAVIYYVIKFRSSFDVIVDSENGIPFFSPLFTTKPVVLLIHHVHQEVFIEQLKFPFSYIGRFVEGKLMPLVYRNKQVITVSESSKREIIKSAIAKNENVQIVNPGIKIPAIKYPKTDFPSIIYLGRIKAYKNIDVAIRSFEHFSKKIRSARLWIVGEGDLMGDLKDLALKLGLEKKIYFFGKVSDEEKIKLLSQSWVAVQPSTVEGWGITVLEANACKTPVVASDTKGLRDSIQSGKTGKLVKLKDIKAFSTEIKKLLTHKDMLEELSKNAYTWARKYRWEKSAGQFYEVLFYEAKIRNNEVIPVRPKVLKKVGLVFNRFSSIF